MCETFDMMFFLRDLQGRNWPYLSIFHFIIRMQSVGRTDGLTNRRAEPERLAHQQEHVGARWRLVWIGWQAIASGWIV